MSEHQAHSHVLDDILRQRRQRTIRIVMLAVVVIALAAGAWWWLGRSEPEPPVMPAPPAPVARPEPAVPEPAVAPAPEPVAPKSTPAPLPALDASDPLVRETAHTLSGRPELTRWLSPSELIRRFVASVDNVAEGRSPREQLGSLWPSEKFSVVGEDAESLTTDPAAYSRYDTLTNVFVSIDSRAAVRAYERLRPLFEEAYRDLGYPDRSFDDALHAAIDELLAAPVVVGEPLLTPEVISYAYADEDLESLSAAQKQLLRLGPANAPRIQRKLREVARELGIPDDDLPLTPIHQVTTPD